MSSRQPPFNEDPLASFLSESDESVAPPATHEVDALIAGGRTTDADLIPRTAIAEPVPAGPVWIQPVLLRWIVTNVLAFGLGVAGVTWTLRIVEPVATPPVEVVDSQPSASPLSSTPPPTEPAPLPEATRPSQPERFVGPQTSAAPQPPSARSPVREEAAPRAAAARIPQVPATRTASLPANRPSVAAGARRTPVVVPPATTTAPLAATPLVGDPGALSVESVGSALSPTPRDLPALANERSVGRVPERAAVDIEDIAVRRTLRDYARAYQAMNVQDTARVWPSVDQRALARAFTTLRSQGLTFESCDVSVNQSSATAHCRGSVEFVRRVGNPMPLTAPQEWRFRMRKFGDAWVIENVGASPLAAAQSRGQS